MVEVVVISKAELRILAKEKRLHLKDKIKKDELILKNIINNKKVLASSKILVYISINQEVDTINLIKVLLKMNKEVYAPKIVKKTLKFYRINNLNELKLGKLNILEPTSRELFRNDNKSCIIVPGLLFDDSHNRLGYGGGYYDRYLKNLSIYKIGVCYQEFKVSKLEVLEHDIKMDEVITERN